MADPTEGPVDLGDTELFVAQCGRPDAFPVIVLHGGPGLDHHEFGDYLDPLADRGHRLLLVDQRGCGRSQGSDPATWTLEQHARDVAALAKRLGLQRYAVLGHSYGAFVALQNAVDFPGAATLAVLSGGVRSSRWLERVEENLAAFEPEDLRRQVSESWSKEQEASTPEEFAALMHEQWPFHFADPRDPRIQDYERRTAGTVFSPAILRQFSATGYGGIEVQDRLGNITQPVLILAGRYDRTCVVEAAQAMVAAIPDAELGVFERSGHMMFVEEQTRFLDVVDDFLSRRR